MAKLHIELKYRHIFIDTKPIKKLKLHINEVINIAGNRNIGIFTLPTSTTILKDNDKNQDCPDILTQRDW